MASGDGMLSFSREGSRSTDGRADERGQPRPFAQAGGPVLSVVVPTFEEAGNVGPLIERLGRALPGIAWEVIVVDDDSPDGTADQVRTIARGDQRVRCIQRIGRRGLAGACIEGMLASSAPYLAVIDADLQHDETLLSRMLAVLEAGEADLVVGSRYLAGRHVAGWDERRVKLSRLGTWLARWLLRQPLTDPMSGFFMIRREAFEGSVRRLSAMGFKILLDLVASSPMPLRIVELPYDFRNRVAGASKMDGRAVHDFVSLLLDKLIGRWVPVRFVLFALVGGMGLLVHLAVLALAGGLLGAEFIAAQTAATIIAMAFNYVVNNELTYRDRRRRGRRMLTGWLSFALACSLGAVANVGVAGELYAHGGGWLLSALGGVTVGAVWNYATTAVVTWSRPRGG